MAAFTPIKIIGIDHRKTQPIREGSDRFRFVFTLRTDSEQVPEKWIELFNDEFGAQPELHWAIVLSKTIVVSGCSYNGVSEAEITAVFDPLKAAVQVVNSRYQELLDEEEAKRNAKQTVIVRLQMSLNFD